MAATAIWDADNHLYEAVDAYTRHLPRKYRSAVAWAEIDGRTKLLIKGKLTDTIPNPTYEVVPTPGAWSDYFRGINPEGKSLRELAHPIRCPDEFRQPAARLALLDRQGVDGCASPTSSPAKASAPSSTSADDGPFVAALSGRPLGPRPGCLSGMTPAGSGKRS